MGLGRNAHTVTLHFRGTGDGAPEADPNEVKIGAAETDPPINPNGASKPPLSSRSTRSSRRRYKPLGISEASGGTRAPIEADPIEPDVIDLDEPSHHSTGKLPEDASDSLEPNLRLRHRSLARNRIVRLQQAPRTKEQRLARGIVAREHLTRIGMMLVQQSGLRTEYPGVDWRCKLFTFSNCKRFGYGWAAVDPENLSKVQRRAMEEYEQKGLGGPKSGVPEVMLSLLMKGKVGLCYGGEIHTLREGSRWSKEVEKVREGLRDVVRGLNNIHVEDDEEEMGDG